MDLTEVVDVCSEYVDTKDCLRGFQDFMLDIDAMHTCEGNLQVRHRLSVRFAWPKSMAFVASPLLAALVA